MWTRGPPDARFGAKWLRVTGGRHAGEIQGVRLGNMTTWEYTTHVITHGLLGRKEEKLDRQEFERVLSELGAQGWEYATTFLEMSLHREKDGHVLLFKRRVD